MKCKFLIKRKQFLKTISGLRLLLLMMLIEQKSSFQQQIFDEFFFQFQLKSKATKAIDD